ncbi:MAG: nicotinate (nicotinamide) nucleotide adenylyltransferase [Balneolaceae bacterium]|nr:nicotinate (nicotinamide) nucleotide adenylyltransferase [Balneolaceae bacterium]
MGSANCIGLMGGSFNPVHNGHISIASSFLESDVIDELWILLTPKSPHKDGEKLAGYVHRLEMLKIVFCSWDNVIVSDFERNLPTPSYTIQTISELKKKYPKKSFYLCLGEDSLANFSSWHKWKEILEKVSLLVASRPDFKPTDKTLLKKAFFVNHDEIAVSSTEVRKKIANGVDVQGLIPDSVLKYIKKHNLYTS